MRDVMDDPRPPAADAATNVQLSYGAAVALCLVGVFWLVRSDETLWTILGITSLFSAFTLALTTRRAQARRDQ